jgi:pimeloyl-ACP methyl ester carboxylesterase
VSAVEGSDIRPNAKSDTELLVKRMQTFGGLAVFEGSRPLGGNAQQPRRLAILAVLARAGARGVSRDRLAGLLWGDVEEARARRSLNQALYALRQELGSEEAILGTRDLRLNSELIEVDLTAFETARASGGFEEAARLYAGPFLADCHLPGAPDFARWAEEEREGIAADYRTLLEAAAAAATARDDRGGAVLWWRRLEELEQPRAAAAGTVLCLTRVASARPDVPAAAEQSAVPAAPPRELNVRRRMSALIVALALGSAGAASPAGGQQESTASRPQEPRPPFPYRTVEVRYANAAAPGVTLAATLTVPAGQGKFPAALLVGGSGQFPRDQPFLGHRMMLVLADYLTRRGIATLRFDDRGAGQSTLGKTRIENLTNDDFVTDARAGIAFLQTRPEIDPRRIGILGHSEGTRTAEIIAAMSPGDIGFIVLLAAASASLTKGEIVAAQSEAMARLAGLSAEVQAADSEFMSRALAVTRGEPDAEKRLKTIDAIAQEALTRVPAPERDAVEPGIRARVEILASDNFHRDAVSERRDYLSEVRCPVLALNGDKDVLVSADDNAPLLSRSLKRGGNRDATVRVLPGLNHMFQTAKTGAMEEAGEIEETFAPSALQLLGDWIRARTR